MPVNLDLGNKPDAILPRTGPVVRVACVLLGALMASACALLAPHYERPDLSVVGITMQSGNLFAQNFLVTLGIHNPNGRALPVERVRAHLLIAGVDVATGVTTGAFVVPPHADSRVDMQITANLAAGIAQIATRMGAHQDTVDYELDGVVRLDTPWLHALSFHTAGVLPLSELTR